MGAFNFIETSFFISLGITFVFIMLLIYHFKQRLSTMEQKSDTMFDIVQNLAKEITSLKSNVSYLTASQMNTSYLNPSISSYYEAPNTNTYYPGYSAPTFKQDINDSEDDDDEDDDESGDNDSGDDEESDEESDDESVGGNEEIKVIDIGDLNQFEEINDVSEVELEIENENDTNMEISTAFIQSTENIQVHKLEETILVSTEKENKPEPNLDIYKKMNITALKALVIEKGLCSETSKMKKADLLRLLSEE
jgi:hypothetical protein